MAAAKLPLHQRVGCKQIRIYKILALSHMS